MSHNLTNLTDASSNLYEVVKNLNDVTSGNFFVIFLISLFVSILLIFPNQELEKLLVLDSFVVSVVSFIGFILGFVGWTIVVLPLIALLGSIIYYKLNN